MKKRLWLTLACLAVWLIGGGVPRALAAGPVTGSAAATATRAPATATRTPSPSATATHTPGPTAAASATATAPPALFLPLVVADWPSDRDAPRLEAIANASGEADYEVSWTRLTGATRYRLEEARDPSFAAPTLVYAGTGLSWSAADKLAGTYFYRVQARGTGSWGANYAWSNVVSTTVLPPAAFVSSADAVIAPAAPDRNLGTYDDLDVGFDGSACHQSGPGAGVLHSVLRFDLSAIPPGTPIQQATLQLETINYCFSRSLAGDHRDLTAYVLQDDWAESTVTWHHQPRAGDPAARFSILLSADLLEVRPVLELTELVRAWVDRTVPNYGLLLRVPEDSGARAARIGFGSREIDQAAWRPTLRVQYQGAGAPMAALDDVAPVSSSAARRHWAVPAPVGDEHMVWGHR